MAVYKRTYSRYTGNLTDERWRFTILPRYAIKTVLESKLNMALFMMALLPHLIAIILIYLRSHLDALLSLAPDWVAGLQVLRIDGNFFLGICMIETVASFFLVALIGPGLVSPDLGNNAMPLYLSRPFSRTEYVLGKLAVLVGITSLITWAPELLLLGIQTSMVGFSWLSENLRLFVGVFIGSWVWILTISLIALALSAWVKWKPVAIASLFGIFFVAAGFGTVTNVLLDTRWGTLINMNTAMVMIWRRLLLGETTFRVVAPPFIGEMPSWTGFVTMISICAIALFTLSRKIRAAQVVR
jgi:ABC-2 type transport system permease protein